MSTKNRRLFRSGEWARKAGSFSSWNRQNRRGSGLPPASLDAPEKGELGAHLLAGEGALIPPYPVRFLSSPRMAAPLFQKLLDASRPPSRSTGLESVRDVHDDGQVKEPIGSILREMLPNGDVGGPPPDLCSATQPHCAPQSPAFTLVSSSAAEDETTDDYGAPSTWLPLRVHNLIPSVAGIVRDKC